MTIRLSPLLLSISLTTMFACAPSGSENLRRADELSREGKYEEAIDSYRKHMEYRLTVTARPEWENPYFYLLLIGDEYLHRGEPAKALEQYEEAERKEVHPTLISDRYRAVARWYEEHGELQQALDILTRFRDRDSLLFDAMADRVARTLTERENQALSKGEPAPAQPPPAATVESQDKKSP
jgi:tetratricopeptide (TPR) repeat protein